MLVEGDDLRVSRSRCWLRNESYGCTRLDLQMEDEQMDCLLQALLEMKGGLERTRQWHKAVASQLAMDHFQYSMFSSKRPA